MHKSIHTAMFVGLLRKRFDLFFSYNIMSDDTHDTQYFIDALRNFKGTDEEL